jgi:glutaminyl-peptide cyclotransferase
MLHKTRTVFVLIALAVTIVAVVFATLPGNTTAQDNTTPAPPAAASEPPFFSGESAFNFAADLMEIGGPHPTGSEEIIAVGDYITDVLVEYGWEVTIQEFEHDANGELFVVRNIIAMRGTEGPITMLATHYDSRLWADADPDPANHRELVPGANDGISSTGVILEYARIIETHYNTDGRIWLTFFDAEDNGRIPGWDWIIGSSYMAENLERDFNVTPEDFNVMILFDLVGEKDIDDYEPGDPEAENADQQEFPIEAYSYGSAPEVVDAIWALGQEMGYGDQFQTRQRGAIIDDHLPFVRRNIPAIDIIDLDYPFWHTVEDTLDKISPQSLDRPGDVVEMYLIQTEIFELKVAESE